MEGFEIPLRRSLTEPILLGGAPRSAAILIGTLAAALALGLRLWIPGLLVWVAGHTGAVMAAKADPEFLSVAVRSLRHKAYLTC